MPRPCDAPERRLSYRLIRRIYAILNSGEWRVSYVRMWQNPKVCARYGLSASAVGTVDFAENVIYLDFREDVLATLVHECIHIILEDRYPNDEAAEEKETQRLEALVMRNMSRCQATRLHRLMADCLSYER